MIHSWIIKKHKDNFVLFFGDLVITHDSTCQTQVGVLLR